MPSLSWSWPLALFAAIALVVAALVVYAIAKRWKGKN